MHDKSFADYLLAAFLARTRANIYNYNENSRASESGFRISPRAVVSE